MARGQIFVGEVDLVLEQCCACQMTFAFPLDFQRRRRDLRDSFYCPAGHRQHYTGATEAEKLKAELEREKERTTAATARAARVERERDRIAKSHNRMRTRVWSGVCPCCDRTFQNLMRHMKTEHSEFDEGQALRAMREAFGMTQVQVAEEVGLQGSDVSRFERGKPVSDHVRSTLIVWTETTP